jgi:hypothetical protein
LKVSAGFCRKWVKIEFINSKFFNFVNEFCRFLFHEFFPKEAGHRFSGDSSPILPELRQKSSKLGQKRRNLVQIHLLMTRAPALPPFVDSCLHWELTYNRSRERALLQAVGGNSLIRKRDIKFRALVTCHHFI